jgi:Outer membrane protein Omp28
MYGILSRPYSDSKYDFRFKEGDDLVRYIGVADGIPAVSANRVLVNQNAQNPFLLAQTQWGGAIRDQAQKAPEVGLFLETEYDPASRDLDIRLNIAPEKTLSGEHRLTVFITQDSIVDLQNDKGVKVPNYVHRHVLRKIVTQPTGDVIAEPLTSRAVVSKELSFNLPAAWEAKHCAVVAFVHRTTVGDLEVLQAVEKEILE